MGWIKILRWPDELAYYQGEQAIVVREAQEEF
jgi:hypothetical protein